MIIDRILNKVWFSQQEPPIDLEVLWLSRKLDGFETKVFDDGEWRIIGSSLSILQVEINEEGNLIVNGEDVGHVVGADGSDGTDGLNAEIIGAIATIGTSSGIPTVTVTMGGTPSLRTFAFDFDGLKGELGVQGVAGLDGQDGLDGTDGQDGTMWFTGTVVTTAGTFIVPNSKIGDIYLNTSTYDVFRLTLINEWTWLCNIQGAPGTPGSATGGNTWYFGTSITGTGTIAYIISGSLVGDLYLNTSTLELYQSLSANTWLYQCTLGIAYLAGTGLTLTNTTFNHTNSTTPRLQEALLTLTYDALGHIIDANEVTVNLGLHLDNTGLGINYVNPTNSLKVCRVNRSGNDIVWSAFTGDNTVCQIVESTSHHGASYENPVIEVHGERLAVLVYTDSNGRLSFDSSSNSVNSESDGYYQLFPYKFYSLHTDYLVSDLYITSTLGVVIEFLNETFILFKTTKIANAYIDPLFLIVETYSARTEISGITYDSEKNLNVIPLDSYSNYIIEFFAQKAIKLEKILTIS